MRGVFRLCRRAAWHGSRASLHLFRFLCRHHGKDISRSDSHSSTAPHFTFRHSVLCGWLSPCSLQSGRTSALYRARTICYCGKASAVSQALDVCNQQAHCSRPKPGNANWALAAAGWPPLHSSTPPVFTASLLHSKSRIIPHRHRTKQKPRRHPAPSKTSSLDISISCWL